MKTQRFTLVTTVLSSFLLAPSYTGAMAAQPQSPLPGCVQPPAGLVSWWPGEGNADDIWGSNDGTLMNGTTFASGLVGQAFSFDGVDDYVDVAR